MQVVHSDLKSSNILLTKERDCAKVRCGPGVFSHILWQGTVSETGRLAVQHLIRREESRHVMARHLAAD